jgi:hypothetical protein
MPSPEPPERAPLLVGRANIAAMAAAAPFDFDDLWSSDRARQNAAYTRVLQLSDAPVGWAYEVWDEVVGNLASRDNHDRAIAAQVLANLAKSDPDARLLTDFPALLAVTRDERFVTARHALQSLWKVGVAGERQRAMLVDALADRYRSAATEKNGTLVRYDILECLRKVYDDVGDEAIRATALELIATEDDAKYHRKYTGLWR